MQTLSSGRAFWALWLALFAARALLAATVPLFGDEAWYWLEGQHLAPAYSDLPGLTAWLIRIGVEAAGTSEFGVRWPFLLLAAMVPVLVRVAARQLGDAAHADQAGMLALLLPLLGGSGWLALPDVPLTFATALCLLAMLRLRERVDAGAALLLGIGLALGATSHYRFALLLLAGGVGLLVDPKARATLHDWRVLLALGVGAVAWLPLLLWNLEHDAAGVAFQLGDRHPWQLHGEGHWLPLSQLAVVSPLLLVLLLATLRSAWRERRAPSPARMLLAFALLPILTYVVLGFFADRERVSFHWLLQAYLPLLLMAPAVFARWPRSWRIATQALAALGLLFVLGYGAVAAIPALRARLADSRWYPDNFAGWREIAQEVRTRLATHPSAALVADNFMLAAQLGFALGRADIPVRDHPLNRKHGRAQQLQLWGAQYVPDHAASERLLLVMEDTALPLKERLQHYAALCDEIAIWRSPSVLNVDRGRKRFLLYDIELLPVTGCAKPAIAWIDQPAAGAALGSDGIVAGWSFKDVWSLGSEGFASPGVVAVEVLIDGNIAARARYGIARPHVASYWRTSEDPAHPNVGFEATLPMKDIAPGQHWLGLRIHGRDGSIEDWPEQRVTVLSDPSAQGSR
jgi:4-amino-4-deoxy-L-arabinose transferase-like glycosyltransferase